jgi:nucleoside-triphosphatase THEP1
MTKDTDIMILSGEPGCGKSRLLEIFTAHLKEAGLRVSGFLASSVPGYLGSYYLVDLRDENSVPFCSQTAPLGWERSGRFYFNPAAIDLGRSVLRSCGEEKPDLVILDEIGPFELSGRIWADALSELLGTIPPLVMLVVRDSLVDAVIRKWDLEDPARIRISQTGSGAQKIKFSGRETPILKELKKLAESID